jgi:hypothetical protein
VEKYRITIIGEATSSLSRQQLESRLVVGLYDLESEEKVSDGETDDLEIIDYELTEAIPIADADVGPK